MKLEEYQIEAVNRGFCFECACGEIHRTFTNAVSCRKCRDYLEDHHNRVDPVDLRKFM